MVRVVVVGILAMGFVIGACAGRKVVDNGGIIGEGEGEGATVTDAGVIGEGEGAAGEGEGEGSR